MTVSWSPELGCWARRDDAPPWSGGEERGFLRDWLWACNAPDIDDLGLCPHHRAALLAALAATRPPAVDP